MPKVKILCQSLVFRNGALIQKERVIKEDAQLEYLLIDEYHLLQEDGTLPGPERTFTFVLYIYLYGLSDALKAECTLSAELLV